MIAVAVGAAALVTLACCAAVVRSGLGRRLIDTPNLRSLHEQPTPRGGGVAIWCGVMVGAVISGAPPPSMLVAFTVLMLLGVVDDRRGVPARIRIVVQAATIVIYLVATRPSPDPFIVAGWPVSLGALTLPVTAAAALWMLNLYNFMDGMDGFAGSMTAIGFGALSWLAWEGGAPTISLACALPAASALGFLVLNLPPARLFLGDSGSVPLGFLAFAIGLTGVVERVWSPVVPIVVFAPFILDATATLLRRASRMERVWVAHRTHVYQRLVVAGLGHKRTLAVEVGFMIAAAALAIVAQRSGGPAELVALAMVLLVYGGLWATAERFERRRPAVTL